jgi:hypothetical protein
MIHQDIIHYLLHHNNVFLPMDYLAAECSCSTSYATRVCQGNNKCRVERRKYGKIYVKYEG